MESLAAKLGIKDGPVSFTAILTYIGIGWLICLALLIVSIISWPTLILGSVLFVLVTLAAAKEVWGLLRARQRVLHLKEVSLLYNMVKLVAWDPTEGILVLRNKSVVFSDDDLDDGRGGIRFVSPVLGEEVGLRIPLEVQTLEFSDDDVLTREYLKLGVRGTVRWRITDIRRFYLLISRELRGVSDKSSAQRINAAHEDRGLTSQMHGPKEELLYASIQWLRGMAESQTRTVVSKLNSGLLLADRLAADIPEIRVSNGQQEWHSGADSLSDLLIKALTDGVAPYGIAIEDVIIRELKFPEAVMQQCIEAAKSAYLPLIGRRAAQASTAQLELEAGILGKEAIAAREVVSNAPALALQDLLASVVAKQALNLGHVGITASPRVEVSPPLPLPPPSEGQT